MKLRSFRLRIALASAVLAGSALIGFGLTAWWQIYDTKVSRLDSLMKGQLMRVARPQLRERWESYEAHLARVLGINAETPIALLIVDSEGNTLYRSAEWPVDLNPASLWRTESMSMLAPTDSLLALAPTDSSSTLGQPHSQLLPPQLPPEGIGNPSLQTQPEPYERLESPPDQLPDRPPPEPQLVTQRTATATWRIGALRTPHVQVAIAVSLQTIDQEMVAIRNIFLISIPVLFLLIAGGAWGLSGSALHPIRQLTVAIRQVTVKGLEQRIPQGTTDVEFVELIQVFNQMLERLERSFQQASRFSGDAAHELKTPLTILQGEMERILQKVEFGSEMQQSLSHLLDEVHRLNAIVRKLLLLSLADAGRLSLYLVEVDLSKLLIEMTEDIELLAPDLAVETEIKPNLLVRGDRDLLVQVLQNLISNAIKYNIPNGWLRIHAERQAKSVSVTVTNSSKNISTSDRERIFDRFYRGDAARTRTVEGTGLGLSLSREIVQAHHGKLTIDPTPSGQTAFSLTLPLS